VKIGRLLCEADGYMPHAWPHWLEFALEFGLEGCYIARFELLVFGWGFRFSVDWS